MKLQFIFEQNDDKLRAEALLDALFEAEGQSIADRFGEATVTVSNKAPAFYIFDTETTKHGNIGWRLAAKSAGEKFFGVKPDVRKVATLAEEKYNKLASQSKVTKTSVSESKSVSILHAPQVIEDKPDKVDQNNSKWSKNAK